MPRKLLLVEEQIAHPGAMANGVASLSHAEWLKGTTGSFVDEAFDAIDTSQGFLGRVLAAATNDGAVFQRLLVESFRLLKPGGVLTLTVDRHLRCAAPINAWLAAASGPSPFNGLNDATFNVRRHKLARGATALLCLKPYSSAGAAADGPLVSVLIPTFNGARYISQTLASLAAQDWRDFEAICADDCSTDATVELAREIAATDPRFRVVRMSSNLGSAAKVLNAVLPTVRSRYVVYSSQDDFYSGDWLSSMVDRMAETAADAVLPDVVLWTGDGNPNVRLAGVNGDREVLLSGREAAFLSLDWQIPGNAMWPTDLVRRLGYEEFSGNSDEYSTRVFFLNCQRVAFSKGTFYYRQDNPEAITKKISCRTFDFPILYLQLARLLDQRGFDEWVVEKEYDKASAVMRRLQTWLKAGREGLNPEELAMLERAQAAYRALEPPPQLLIRRYISSLREGGHIRYCRRLMSRASGWRA